MRRPSSPFPGRVSVRNFQADFAAAGTLTLTLSQGERR